MRARTTSASLLKMLQPLKLADPPMEAPPPCMQKYAISRVTFQRALEEGSRRFKNASAHVFCLVAEEIAVAKVRMALNVGPAALYAKVCNQSRNVPAGRWKKAPESSKCKHQHAACQNSTNVSEFTGALEEGSRRFKMRAPTC